MKRIAFTTLIGALVLLGCSKETKKIEVTPESVILYSDGQEQLTTNVEDATFSVKDDFYVTVSATGLVEARKVGETEILVSSSIGTASVPVKIMSKYTLYPDIDNLVGKSLNDITAVMGFNYESSTSTDGELTYLYRNPTSYVDAIMFMMKGSVVNSIGVLVPTTNASMIAKHMAERYTVAGTQNDIYFFLNHDMTVSMALQVYSIKYIIVLYMDNTDAKSPTAIEWPVFNFEE